jgi:hypothetical protein
MRWLCRSVTVVALLAAFSSGCGSTAGGRLVFLFIRFDNTGITQVDSVRESSADVDVVQDLCVTGTGAMVTTTVEPFTQTTINAVFRNEEASNIRLEGYAVHISDPNSGLGDFSGTLNGNIVGGRCSNLDKQCADDADCSEGTSSGTCTHSESTVTGILLFDFLAKQSVNPAIYGVGTNMTVTFFASDPNQSFDVAARYVVTFADFDNCMMTSGTGGA